MKLISSFIKHFFAPCFILLLTMVVAGCSEDKEELQQGDGYVQFKLYKSASYDDVQSRATSDKLDNLSQAKKMQVVLLHNNVTITQTVALSSYSDQEAEYGLRSDKLELTAGEYTLVGYYLYDKVEQPILAGEPSKLTTFVVSDGGLTVQNVLIDAVMTGKVNFTLIKDLPSTRTHIDQEPFENIYQFQVEVKNLETKETKIFRDIKVKYKEGFGDKNVQIATATTDTTLFLKAGTYQYVRYYLYKKGDSNNPIGYLDEFPEGLTFTVEDNKLTKAKLPVKIGLADYLKDYAALKEIWEKLGGKKWSYVGELYPRGANWSFDDKQMDMWGQQPGVTLDDKGRVSALNIGGFNPQGAIPECLGDLTALRVLTIGTHNDAIGGGPVEQYGGNPTPAQMKTIRNDYYNKFLARDPRAGFSKALQFGFKLKGEPIIERKNGGISQKDVQFGEYTNGVTSIPASIGNLTNLEQFYVANSKITSLPSTMSKLKCSDVEVYNCPLMTTYPKVLNQIEGLQLLIVAVNKQWSHQILSDGLVDLANSKGGETVQILYLGNNNLTSLPDDLSKLKNLHKLDCINNKISGKLKAFPSTVNLSQLTMGNNQITGIIPNAEGKFCGYTDVESFSFTNNQFTVFPDIFDAKSIYVMGGVDFSHNQITSIENGDLPTYGGVNASTVDLSYNKLKEFPKALFSSGSPMSSLNLAGNEISTFKKGSLVGKNSNMLTSLDLSFNQLTELPSDFEASTLPYLYGLELSYNRFSAFPYNPLNIAGLTILSIRHQRDADGNRCLREWPKNIYKHVGLRALYLTSNDIRKVEDDQISYLIYNVDISDNPNIVINVADVCSWIKAGAYNLYYDPTQDIRGCDALNLK